MDRREDRPPGTDEFPSSRLVPVLGPFIGAAAFTAALAIVAALLDWYRYEMLFAAAAITCAAAIPTIYLIYRQLAERKVAQSALRAAQARVGGIVEAAMDAVISVDEQQRVVLFNRAAERVFRWPRTAVLGQRLDLLIPERYHAAHRDHIERFGRTATTSRGMGSQTVLHGVRADGEEFPIEASISQHEEGGRKLYTVILRDVTDRVRNERLLARSEARLRGILDSAMDAIITVDSRQHIVLFNRAAEDVFGCPRDQAIGAPLAWFIPERFRHAHSGLVQRFGDIGASSRRMGGGQRIVMGLRRNGEEFPLDASISHIVEEGEHFFTVILRDVTERVQNEEALRESREEIRNLALAASAVREQEKSRIARELHDELGQALTALKIDVTWLREHLRGGPDSMLAKLTSMQVLLDGTVAAARRISSDLRPLMLDDLGLVAACEWLAHNFQQRTGTPCELVLGRGELDLRDPYATAVFRVMQESLTNVAKHAEASQVEATLERSGETVTLTVRDNGRGFDTSAPRKQGSYGMVGLRERAYLLGGDIHIESAPGQGTLVEMRIPVNERIAEET
ncbi:MAG TPA: PAS domain-containing sensor histidine kinase [Usitatibacter sp.]|nr:PAS domain-containing sensor histidine kinase [Usitatibacter sp.]